MDEWYRIRNNGNRRAKSNIRENEKYQGIFFLTDTILDITYATMERQARAAMPFPRWIATEMPSISSRLTSRQL